MSGREEGNKKGSSEVGKDTRRKDKWWIKEIKDKRKKLILKEKLLWLTVVGE